MRRSLVLTVSVLIGCSSSDPSFTPGDAAAPPSIAGPERAPSACECRHQWSKRFGPPTGHLFAGNLASDPNGNIVGAGFFTRVAVDFGGGPLSYAGNSDAVMVKLGPDGTHIWSKSFGGTNSESFRTVATGDDGSIYVAGTFNGSFDLGRGPLVSTRSPGGSPEVFMARLDAAGNTVWSKAFATEATGTAAIEKIAMRGRELFVAGVVVGAIDLGGGPIASTSRAGAMFVAKLTDAGDHVWSKTFSQAEEGILPPTVAGAGLDAQGNVVVAGSFRSAIELGGDRVVEEAPQSNQSGDIYVVKLDGAGGRVWSTGLGDYGEDLVTGAAVAPTGEVYLSGNGLRNGPDSKERELFLLQLDSAGRLAWRRDFVGFFVSSTALARDRSGRLALAGAYNSLLSDEGLDLGCGSLPRPREARRGDPSLFVATFDDRGRCQWSFGTGTDDVRNLGHAVAFDPSGALFFGGSSLASTIDLGGGPLESTADVSTLLAKVGP